MSARILCLALANVFQRFWVTALAINVGYALVQYVTTANLSWVRLALMFGVSSCAMLVLGLPLELHRLRNRPW